MLQALHDRGIQPMVCLHHFTHPMWFENKGGFLGAEASRLFERFTRHVLHELGDLCQHWVTFNEPNVYGALGHVLGEFPPGSRGQILRAIGVVGAMARAHTAAYRAIHELQPGAQVGWAHNYIVFQPANRDFAPDRWISRLLNELFNESFLQLMEQGRLGFPFNLVGKQDSDSKGMCDFVGLNVYSRFHVAFDLRCAYGEAYPEAIRVAVLRAASLGKPIYILENGVPDAQDRIRPWLIVKSVQEMHSLIHEGFDLRGYFHWTLTDNFEWSEGWRLRFGLVALDPGSTQNHARQRPLVWSHRPQ